MAAARLQEGDGSGPDVSQINWDAIWAAAEGSTSEEQAIGRVVLAGYLAVRDTPRPARKEDVDPPPSTHVAPQPSIAVANVVPPLLTSTVEAPPDRNWLDDVDVQQARRLHIRRRGLATFFGWMRNIGAIILLFVAWQLWGTSISQHHAQHQLKSTFEATVRAHKATPSKSSGHTLIPADKIEPVPAEGTPVAQLQIPAIGLNEYVVSGTAEGDLAKGPGHYVGTAAPGQAGNVAIAGHRTTNGAPFNRLGQLAIGNQIYLTTTSGERFTYVVSQLPQAVSPSDVAVLNNFGDNRITLTTCNPEFSSSQRLVVVGKLNQPVSPTAPKTTPRAYHVVDAQTSSWHWSSLPLVVLEAGALVLLGLGCRRFSGWFGGIGRWLILTPIWIAGLYILFQSLVGFLPPTV